MTDRPTIERAFDFTIEETRDGDGLTLEGYAAVFNSPTEINSWEGKFTEIIAPGAFKRTIGQRTPVMQFDHGHHPLIGGLPIGVIRSLSEDARGLKVRARLSDNWLIHPIRDAIRDKAITGMSFRFTVRDDDWDDDVRTIKEVELHEVGPVVFPAYSQTSVGVRSASDPISQLVNLIRSDESLREPLAAALTFGTSEEPAAGTSEDRATSEEETDSPPVEAPVADVSDAPEDPRKARWADFADMVDREAHIRERKRLHV